MPDENVTTDATATVSVPAPVEAVETPGTAPEPPEAPVGEHSAADDEPDAGQDTFDRGYVGKLRDEAARHRTAAREAEAERDALRAERDALEARHFERALRDAGVRDDAIQDTLALAGDLSEMRDDTNMLDEARVSEFLGGLREQRGHWFAERFPPMPHGSQPAPEPGPSFGAHLKGVVGRR